MSRFLTKDFLIKVASEGFVISITTIIAFLIGYKDGNALLAGTMAFGTLCMARLFHGFNCKADRPIIFTKRLFDNLYLIGAFVIGFVLITSVLMIPALNGVFHVQTLTIAQLFTVYGMALLNFPVIQAMKAVKRWMKKR